jgi:hypothetical protein
VHFACNLLSALGQKRKNALRATALAGLFPDYGGTGLALPWALQLLGQEADTGA